MHKKCPILILYLLNYPLNFERTFSDEINSTFLNLPAQTLNPKPRKCEDGIPSPCSRKLALATVGCFMLSGTCMLVISYLHAPITRVLLRLESVRNPQLI